jgi:hypothetical protein
LPHTNYWSSVRVDHKLLVLILQFSSAFLNDSSKVRVTQQQIEGCWRQ